MKNPRLITSPSDLLIAIPFLLGFTPAHSLIVVSIKGQIVDLTMRSDFPPQEKYSEVAEELLAQLGSHKAEEILLVAYLPAELGFNSLFLKQLFIDCKNTISNRTFALCRTIYFQTSILHPIYGCLTKDNFLNWHKSCAILLLIL